MPGYQPGLVQQGAPGYFQMPQTPQYGWVGPWSMMSGQVYTPQPQQQQPAMPAPAMAPPLTVSTGQGSGQGGPMSVASTASGSVARRKEEQQLPSWLSRQRSDSSSSLGTPQPSPALPEGTQGVTEAKFFSERKFRALNHGQTRAVLDRFPLYKVEFLRLQPQFMVQVMDEGGNPQTFIDRRLAERRGVTDAERLAIIKVDRGFSKTMVDAGASGLDGVLTGKLACLVRSSYAVSTLIGWLREEHHAVAGKYPLSSVTESGDELPDPGPMFDRRQIEGMRSGGQPRRDDSAVGAKRARQEMQPGW